MPRVKSKAAPVTNSITSTNGINADELTTVVKGARSKKTSTAGDEFEDVLEQPFKRSATVARSRKKATDSVVEHIEEVVVEKKSSTAKGRGKKAAPATTTVQEVDELDQKEEQEPKKGRGRIAKKAVAEEQVNRNLGNDVANGQEDEAAKATKSGGKGRKRKEATPAPEVEIVKAPTKRATKKSDNNVANEGKELLPLPEEQTVIGTQISPKLNRGKANKAKKAEEEPIVDIAIKATGKRGRGKKSEQEALTVQADEIVQETMASPKKKAKKDDDLEKSKPVVATKAKNMKAKKDEIVDEAVEEEFKPAKAAPVAKRSTARKRATAAVTVDDDAKDEDEVDGAKPAKAKKTAPLNATNTSYNKADFELPAASDGATNAARYNLKIASWNVAGLRSWIKKDGLKYLDYEEPDIFCMQEIKCTTDQLPEEAERIAGYHPYWLCMPGGYAGVAIYSKIMPINVEYGIGNVEFDNTGRIITAEYEKFFLINVYVPNSGRKLVNLEPRMRWEQLFQQYVQKLNARKPVVICGDMNVSHQEIDLANPKTNTRNAGFTKEEREKMSELLALGYVDTYRHLYPKRKGAYTYWTYIGNARSRNVGWRLDYFIVSERIIKRVVDNCMRTQCMGSDHCPITLFLKL